MESARYWEEEASVWPPRSYFCNFCGREFGSAQALGGHMNVHRRDRARLKQSPGFQNYFLHHQHQNHHKITLVYNPNSRAFVSPSEVSIPVLTREKKCHRPDISVNPTERKKENVSRKRQRDDELFVPKSSSMKRDHLQAEVKRLCQDATQDLDLELRLGFSLI
ncbi:hypothetical protein P3X46_028936 [Hevea brasiliensis]|uniref:C2H2-type domain-containing protein n=1 Tax=Hevea brasiliensis TaxID=3981 RepID=A0ABQ9KTR9_HEVBR|nr:transcriptional regulator SUPERMAN-like [Hevea brasiliensis]KAJ9146703.1 hypothetical protein P3X46_028936 [Hevea brasiliensis]